MTKILEIKDKLIKLAENYATYVNLVVKFIVAYALFSAINRNIGYMTQLTSVPIMIIFALISCILPVGAMLVIAAIMVILHIYMLSLEAAVVTLILLLIIYLLYFRFASGEGMTAAVTPILLGLGIPYVMPVACGLLRKAYAVISIICGTVLFYYLEGLRQNEAAFAILAEEESDISSGFSVAIAQITGNREMFLSVGVFLAVTLIVYLVRRLDIEYAWTIAIVSGTLIEFGGMFTGYMILNITGRYVSLIVGCILTLLIAFLIQFFCMDLDYARTERVQFEDDEYYYYVKAVPKKVVASSERTVKHFGNTASMGRRIQRTQPDEEEDEELSRRVIAQELDIDEDLL